MSERAPRTSRTLAPPPTGAAAFPGRAELAVTIPRDSDGFRLRGLDMTRIAVVTIQVLIGAAAIVATLIIQTGRRDFV